MRFVGFDACDAPNILQMRLLQVDKNDEGVAFAQVTVRVVARVKLAEEGAFEPVEAAEEDKRRREARATARRARETMDRASRQGQGQGGGDPAAEGSWVQAETDDGKVYFWNTETRETRWDDPSAVTAEMTDDLASSASKPNEDAQGFVFEKQEAGFGSGAAFVASGAATIAGANEYEVVYKVVMERSLFHDNSAWRICQSQAMEQRAL